jgi:hypothetical protein
MGRRKKKGQDSMKTKCIWVGLTTLLLFAGAMNAHARFSPARHSTLLASLAANPHPVTNPSANFQSFDAENSQDGRGRTDEKSSRADELYQDGMDSINDSNWEGAYQKFDQVANLNGSNTDAALYWKAYSADKLGRRADALSTVAQLEHAYPKSKWLDDAKALELQVRQETGQPVSPTAQSDEELKLLAINGLMESDPSRAVPLLENVLNGNGSLRLKERALFVLAQSGSQQASQILGRVAAGQAHPELQSKAVQYLGLFGGASGRQELASLYDSSDDLRVKKAILNSFMISGDRERLLAAAKSDKSPELQQDAVRLLGVSGARSDLWQLYQTNPSLDTRKDILRALFIAGDSDHLLQLAKTEKTPELRMEAIRDLGLIGSDRTGSTLVSLYAGAQDRDVSKAVISALFLQNNAQSLVNIARKETDPELKKAAVEKLSLMHSKVATDYLLEILNK